MIVFYSLLVIASLYFFIVFIALRLITPFMGFGKLPILIPIPEEIKIKIKELESASATPEEYLVLAYGFVTSRWHAGRFDTIQRAPLAFRKDLTKIWSEPGYAHCNTQNYILFVLLVGSKFFNPEDVKGKCVFFNFFIHQYLQVQVAGRLISADPAGASIRHKPLGSHIKLFG